MDVQRTITLHLPADMRLIKTIETVNAATNDILVVGFDAKENARQVLGEMLAGMGLKVEQAESGRAAIVAVERAEAEGMPYEIVFLDWHMQGMDGNETARRLKKLPLIRVPHMMMVTAYGREEVIRGAEDAGVESVLLKPVSCSVLFDSVVRILGGFVDGDRSAGDAPTGAAVHGSIRVNRYLIRARSAPTPSRQVIFLPSLISRPA